LQVERNGYGRQLDSRIARLQTEGIDGDLEAVFIRAPIIRRVGRDAKVSSPAIKATRCWWNKAGIWRRHFIRNLTEDSRVHLKFLNKVP
jgi:pyridoxal 5'-phosphate synthase pdxT subunit